MTGSDIHQKLIAAKAVVTDPRLRVLTGKKKTLVEDGNVYGERIDEEAFERFVDKAFAAEAARRVLLSELREAALSVEALSERTGVGPAVLFRHLLVLQQKGQVVMERVEDDSPLYRSTVSG
jgi:DNA-binding transcriptional ArsR family regulator